MEAVIRAVAEEEWKLVVGPLIKVVSELVMDRGEVFRFRLDAHLNTQVIHVIDVPGARMAHHLAIARPREERPFPESPGQRHEAKRGVETFAGPHHVLRVHLPVLEDVRERITGIGVGRLHERIDVRPVLRPDVAEQMRRNRAVGGNHVAVLFVQLHPHVSVKRQI